MCRTSCDAVHPRHVDVADDQVVMARAHGVPAVDAVDRDVDGVAAALEQLPLQLADGDRVVDDQDPLRRARLACSAASAASLPSRRPESRLSIERIRSSTSTISTGQPSSSTEALLMLGTLPSRASSGETARSRSPRNRSTTTPKRWLRSLATTTGKTRRAGAVAVGGQLEHAASPRPGRRAGRPARCAACPRGRGHPCGRASGCGRSGSRGRRRARRRSRPAGHGSPRG